jgi:hypothetical protein
MDFLAYSFYVYKAERLQPLGCNLNAKLSLIFNIFFNFVFTKIIKNQINLVPAGRREFKPVETMKSVVDESGRLQPLGCN